MSEETNIKPHNPTNEDIWNYMKELEMHILYLTRMFNDEKHGVRKEIKDIHSYLYGGNIVSPMGNGSLRQRIVKGVKDALA